MTPMGPVLGRYSVVLTPSPFQVYPLHACEFAVAALFMTAIVLERVDLDQFGWTGTMEPKECDGPYKAAVLKFACDNGYRFKLLLHAGRTFVYGRKEGLHTLLPAISRDHGAFHFNGYFVEYRHMCHNPGAISTRAGECTVGAMGIRLGEPCAQLPVSELAVCHFPPTLPRHCVQATQVSYDCGSGYVLMPGNCVYSLVSRLHLDDYKVEIGEFAK